MKQLAYLFLSLSIAACNSFGNDNPQVLNTSEENGSSYSDYTGYGGDPTLGAGAVDPYAYLNILRKSAGMTSLETDTQLETAAGNHVDYLVENGYQYGHSEMIGTTDFTGEFPVDRVVHAGYHSLQVGEGISVGITAADAIDGLMSAIYHRFTLLDPSFNEIGIGSRSAGDEGIYLVHNIGNSDANAVCESQISATSGQYYPTACSPSFNVSRSAYDNAIDNSLQANPDIIVWPPKGANDIPPAFFEEYPDPLSDYTVSGYPVSIQFNSGQVSNGAVSQIRLFDTVENRYVDNVRMMSKATDPNDLFSKYDYALFPLQRLEWGRTYRVEIEYTLDGIYATDQWTFTTRELNGPVTTISPITTSAFISNNTKSYFYFEPSNGNDTLNQYQTNFPRSAQVQVSFLDQNTLEITISGQSGDELDLTVNGNRVLRIMVI